MAASSLFLAATISVAFSLPRAFPRLNFSTKWSSKLRSQAAIFFTGLTELVLKMQAQVKGLEMSREGKIRLFADSSQALKSAACKHFPSGDCFERFTKYKRFPSQQREATSRYKFNLLAAANYLRSICQDDPMISNASQLSHRSSFHLRWTGRPHTRHWPLFEFIVPNVANKHVTRGMCDHLRQALEGASICSAVILACHQRAIAGYD